jgi:hypothetical protein
MGMSRIAYGLAWASCVGLSAAAGALANIGPNGTQVAGAHAGLVVASPSKTDPDCEPDCQTVP